MANAHLVRGCQRRSVAIVKVTALNQNRQALTRLLAQRIGRALHKVGIDNGLVVVQKDNGIVTEHRSAGKPHIANGAVSAQAHALARALGSNLRHTVGDTRCLGVGNHGDFERRVRVDDFVDALRHISRGRDGTNHQKDNPRNVAHLLERGQAAVELGIGGVKLRRVVIGAGSVCAGIIARPICWNHNRGVHAFPPCNTKTGRRQTQATPRDLADSIIPTWANHCSQVAMFIADNPKRVPWTGTIAARSYAACSAARVMRDRRTSSIKPTISSTPMERTPSDGLPVSEVTTDTRKVPITLA